MIKYLVVSLASLSLLQCIAQELTSVSFCAIEPESGRSVRLSVNSKRNQSGEWEDTFTARTESSNSSESMGMDVTHQIVECEGKRIIYVQGVSKGSVVSEGVPEAMPVKIPFGVTFHPRHGTNVKILNYKRTVQKINNDDPENSVAFTNIPLKNNEMFEIRLDKKGNKFSRSLGFGVLTTNPIDVKIWPHFVFSPAAWMYYHDDIYSNNTLKNNNYGKNINELGVGDTMGVMRKESGSIHFFVNGVDQGPIPNFPSEVYGVVELCNNAQKATIIRP